MIQLASLQLLAGDRDRQNDFQRTLSCHQDYSEKSGKTWKTEMHFCGKIKDGVMDNYMGSGKSLLNMQTDWFILRYIFVI